MKNKNMRTNDTLFPAHFYTKIKEHMGLICLFQCKCADILQENTTHSFYSFLQHRWRHTVRFFVDLESMGIGGKSTIFQVRKSLVFSCF